MLKINPFKKQDPASTVDERYSNETGEIITKHYKIVEGIKMLTGYTRDSNPDRKFSIPPLEIPAGFNQLITAPTTELDNLNVTNESDQGLPDSADKNNDGIPDQSQADTTSWANEVDMNDMTSVQNYVDSITAPAKGLSKIGEIGILGAANQITDEYQLGVISAVTTNKDIKSYVDAQLSSMTKTNKNPLTSFLRNIFTTPTKSQLSSYRSKQTDKMEKEISDPTNISYNYSSSGPATSGSGYSSAQAEQNAQAAGINDSSYSPPSISAVDMGGPDVGGTTSNDNNDNNNNNSGGPFNKGGLASKKSKKSYDKGGYYTNKKMNTGGLVKKKKKK